MSVTDQSDLQSEVSSNDDSYSENEQEIDHKRKSELNHNQNKRLKLESENGHDNLNRTKENGHKPLTADELHGIRETENLYKSNLFKLQIGEQLEEIKVKPKYKNLFESWFDKFKGFIDDIPKYGEITLSPNSHKINRNLEPEKKEFMKRLNKSYKSRVKTDSTDITMKFIKPEQCTTFGLHKINATVGPELTTNINLTMPKSCFLEKDYLNNRYVVKRQYYLLYIYLELQNTNLCSQLSYIESNLVLQITPDVSKKIQVYLHVTPAENTFKLSRFEPDKNNLRQNLFDSFDDVNSDEFKDCGTPYYNSLVLRELTLVNNYQLLEKTVANLNNVQDAIKLLLLWLGKRGLCLNYSGFSEELLSQLIVYLSLKQKINKHMSSYQVIRTFWVFLSTTNWHEDPISICEDVTADKLQVFSKHFDVVFLDKSGSYNLAALLYLDVYMKIKDEAEAAVKFIDDRKMLNSFDALFITELKPELQYDVILRISDDHHFKSVNDTVSDAQKYKYQGCIRRLLIKRTINLLKKGLQSRVVHIIPLVANSNEEDPASKKFRIPEEAENQFFTTITFGLTLNSEDAFRVIEIGPSANTSTAVAFRKFWGNLSEVRRFADGSICEAVYFPTKTFQDKRQIVKKIIGYVVREKLHLQEFDVISDEFEQMLVLKDYITPFPVGTCEEASLKNITVFDELSKILRGYPLPLEISTIQSASEVYSYTNVFPQIPTNYKWDGKVTTCAENNIVFKTDVNLKSVPIYVEPIECVIQLGMNSNWPNTLEALCHTKTTYYLEVSKLLQKAKILSNVKDNYFDVFYKGLAFRFRLYHPKEVSFLKKYTKPDGEIAYKDTEDSLEMEKNLNVLPKIIGALSGIQSQNPSYGPSTTLIKRWLRSQLVNEYHIPDIVISLLNASLYLNSAPYNTANLPQVAFLRFLEYMSKFQCDSHYVVVNFNDELTRETIDDFDSNFRKNRKNFAPLFILTPLDDGKSIFSKTCSKEIVMRLIVLAKATYNNVLTSIKLPNWTTLLHELFIPNLGGYDVLIRLKIPMNPKRHQWSIFFKNSDKTKLEEYDDRRSIKIPIVSFNPVESYLMDLKGSYDHLALFFHNSYGGNTIAVLWRPAAFKVTQFHMASVPGRQEENYDLVLNKAVIIEDFYVLGRGLVKTIEAHRSCLDV